MAEQPISLMSHIMTPECTCLNESDDHRLKDLLGETGYLESDCDEQLLISLPFNSVVRVHSLLLNGTASRIRLFTNQISFDFQNAEDEKPQQVLELTKDQLGQAIPLKFVNFQKVHTLTLFVEKNFEDDDVTKITKLEVIGFPIKSEGTRVDSQTKVSNTRVASSDIKDFYN